MTRFKGGFVKTRSSGLLRAQGATEYLVLLAVVLVVALVAISLLSSETSNISDIKAEQNALLWQTQKGVGLSASAGYKLPYAASSLLVPYLQISNPGTDPIRLSAIHSGSGSLGSYYSYSSGTRSLADIVIQPGETKCFGPYSNCDGYITLSTQGNCGGFPFCLNALNSNCQTGGSGYAQGTLGFTYDVLVGGIPISKNQADTEIILKCGGCAYYGGTTGTIACGYGQ